MSKKLYIGFIAARVTALLFSCKGVSSREGDTSSLLEEEFVGPMAIRFISQEDFDKLKDTAFIHPSDAAKNPNVTDISKNMSKNRKVIGILQDPSVYSGGMARLIQERGGTVDLSKYTFEIDGKKFELMDGILPDSLLSDFYYDERGLTWSEALLYKTSKGKFIEVRGTSSFGMFRFVNALLYQGAPYYGVSGSGPVFVSPKGYVVSMPEIEFLPANILLIDLGDGQARTINAADSLSRARIIDSNEGKVVRSVTPAAVYHVKGKDKACIVEYKEKLNPSDQEQNIPQSSYLLIRWK